MKNRLTKFIESTVDLFGQPIKKEEPAGKYKVLVDFFTDTISARRAEVIQKVAPPNTYVHSYEYLDRLEFKTSYVKHAELMSLVSKHIILSYTVLLA